MTTLYQLVPSPTAPPQFTPTLDGQQYLITVTWGLFGQRYYVNCYSLNGVLQFSVPLLESPAALEIATASWDVASQLVTVITSTPHGYKIGSVVELTLLGCSPDAYNGAYAVFISGASSFTYPLTLDPGVLTAPGSAAYLISMAAGYFSSTLTFANGSFVVNP